ncbi:MAG: glycosyltransferase family 2 protein [Vicinamibacterales bacterium]
MAAADAASVVIVAPVHNRKDLTLGCLESIDALSRSGLSVRTVIVDDGSTDGTGAAIAAAHPGVEVIRTDGTAWFTEGTNVGVRRALTHDPDFVLMINDDQVFDSRCLECLVETARRYPRTVVGPLLFLWDRPRQLFQTAPVWDSWRGGWRHWHHQTIETVPDRPWTVDLIVGNCVLVPAEAFRECGLMDARRFPNYGDAEFTPRLRKAGWQLVIDPRAHVYCQPNTPPASPRSLPWSRRVAALVGDLKHPHNIRRRFLGYWHGAPTPVHGVVAFVMFFVRWGLGRNIEGAWGASRPEAPLRDVFANRRLDEAPGDPPRQRVPAPRP